MALSFSLDRSVSGCRSSDDADRNAAGSLVTSLQEKLTVVLPMSALRGMSGHVASETRCRVLALGDLSNKLVKLEQQVSQACSPDSAPDGAAADLDKGDSGGKPNLNFKGPGRWLTTRRSLMTILWLWHEIGMTAQEVESIVFGMGG